MIGLNLIQSQKMGFIGLIITQINIGKFISVMLHLGLMLLTSQTTAKSLYNSIPDTDTYMYQKHFSKLLHMSLKNLEKLVGNKSLKIFDIVNVMVKKISNHFLF